MSLVGLPAVASLVRLTIVVSPGRSSVGSSVLIALICKGVPGALDSLPVQVSHVCHVSLVIIVCLVGLGSTGALGSLDIIVSIAGQPIQCI